MVAEGVHASAVGVVQLLDVVTDPGPGRACMRNGELCSMCSGPSAVADCRYPASVWERDGVGFRTTNLSELDARGGLPS